MKKQIHFIGGLPRAGSTLLCNILAQNPRFHVTSTSGILEVLFSIRSKWNQIPEFKASPNEQGKLDVLKGALNGYFDSIEQPVVFDKSRGWLGHLEMAELILERKAKVLVPVRNVAEVIADFEKLWRSNTGLRQFGQEQNNYAQWQTVEGRCEIWARSDQPVGIAYNRIKDAFARGFADRMHLVPFLDLTHHPAETLDGIYDFLGLPRFKHNFDHVEQVTHEDDEAYGIPSLHTIRPKVEPDPMRAETIIGKELAEKYSRDNFWAPRHKREEVRQGTESPLIPYP